MVGMETKRPVIETAKSVDWFDNPTNEVYRMFLGWGLVIRERRLTGDDAAIPKPDRDGYTPGSNRGAPSDIPGVQEQYLQVDGFVNRYLTQRQRDLCKFVFAESIYEPIGMVVYVLTDGTRTDPLPLDAPPPGRYESAEHRPSRACLRYDLDRFVCPELEPVFALWGITKRSWLRRELRLVARRWADKLWA